MRALEAAAVVLLAMAIAASALFGYAAWSSWASGSSRQLQPFVSAQPPPSASPGLVAQVALKVLGSLGSPSSSGFVRAVAQALNVSLLARRLGLSYAAYLANRTYFYFWSAYNLTVDAKRSMALGQLGQALAYANESLGRLAVVNSTLSALESELPTLEAIIGASGTSQARSLISEAFKVSGLLSSTDRELEAEAIRGVNVNMTGNVHITLLTPSSALYGSQVNVSGRAIINGSVPASGALVEIKVGNNTYYVVTNSSGNFKASFKAPLNASGELCVAAFLAPIYPKARSNLAENCINLEYYRANVTLELRPVRALPGSPVAVIVKINASEACRATGAWLIMDGQRVPVNLGGSTGASATVYVPSSAPTGPVELQAVVNMTPPCAPSVATAAVDVYRLPSSLSVSAPPVWFSLLPLPVSAGYRVSGRPGAAELEALANGSSASSISTGGSVTLWVPYVSALGGYVYINVSANPVNVTWSPAWASTRAYEVPGLPILVAAVGGLAYYVVRRRKGLGGPVTTTGAPGPLDPLLARAWGLLEGLASPLVPLTSSSTARELARAASTLRPELSGALARLVELLERGAYGRGLDRAEREELEGLLRSLGASVP